MEKNLLLIIINILFIGAIWYMDVNHNLDRLGERQTRGIFKINPETGYRISQYILIVLLVLLDLLVVLK